MTALTRLQPILIIGAAFVGLALGLLTPTGGVSAHVIEPALMALLCFVFLSVDVRMGLVMLLVTPCTDWYLVFTGLARGNVELGASILSLNLLLQICLPPVYLSAFFLSCSGCLPH